MSERYEIKNKYVDFGPGVRLTQGESNVDILEITGPRTYAGRIDMSTLTWYIRGVNREYNVLVERGLPYTVVGDQIIFRWEVASEFCACGGKLDLVLIGRNDAQAEVLKICSSGINVQSSPEHGTAPPEDVFERAVSDMERLLALVGAQAQEAGAARDTAVEAAAQAQGDAEAANGAADAAKNSEMAVGQHAQTARQSEAAAADSATLAESWAVGGTGSRAGEDVNNARYWARQAASIAQGQKGYFQTAELLRREHPTAEAGDWAIIGDTDSIWVWDADGQGWVDSHQGMELANYYTKDEALSKYDFATEADIDAILAS